MDGVDGEKQGAVEGGPAGPAGIEVASYIIQDVWERNNICEGDPQEKNVYVRRIPSRAESFAPS